MNGDGPQYLLDKPKTAETKHFLDKPKTAETKQKYIKVAKLKSSVVSTSTKREMAELGNALIE